ncbi:conserved hypothetical protein [Gammaproteobacteria bacterium]
MFSRFDWLRRSRTGTELLATLQYMASYPDIPEGIGPPHSALHGPCQRCWIYPRAVKEDRQSRYCETCGIILKEAWRLRAISRNCVVVWGFVNQLPDQLQIGGRFRNSTIFDPYVHDDQRFLLMLYQRELRPWLQELMIYNGTNLRGFIQILPTSGLRETGMGDVLCRVIQNEAQFSMDLLRIRFFAETQQIFAPNFYDRKGVLTFDVTEFLGALEMATVFRSLLRPDEQEQVYQVLRMNNSNEEKFYWGRLLNGLSAEARDMLQAWRMRQWSIAQINLLYDLMHYVEFQPSR